MKSRKTRERLKRRRSETWDSVSVCLDGVGYVVTYDLRLKRKKSTLNAKPKSLLPQVFYLYTVSKDIVI